MPKMKKSGSSWMGDIPETWDAFATKYAVSINNGKDPILEGDIPVYGSGAESFRTCGEFKTGPAVLLGRKGTIDIPRYVEGKYWNVDTAFDAKTREGYNSKFFYYVATCFDYDSYVTSTAVPSMTQSDYKNIKVPKIPYALQERIADYLDQKCSELDALLEELEREIEVLENYKKTVVTETVVKGLNYGSEITYSGLEWLGDISSEVVLTPLKYLLESGNKSLKVGPFGSQLSGEDIVAEDTGYWIYNQRTVLDNNCEAANAFITEEKYHSMAGFQVQGKDILITTRGTIGRIMRVPAEFHRGIIHPCIMKFRIDENKMMFGLLQRLFNDSDYFQKQLNFKSNSTTIEVIYSETLKNIMVPVWPIDKQKQICDFLNHKCDCVNELISNKRAQLSCLSKYKKSLIYEYVTGKKEVPSCE